MERREFIKKSTVAGFSAPVMFNSLQISSLAACSAGMSLNVDIPAPCKQKLVVNREFSNITYRLKKLKRE
jgi:hypothetical protein